MNVVAVAAFHGYKAADFTEVSAELQVVFVHALLALSGSPNVPNHV